jgi:hypothetical protein
LWNWRYPPFLAGLIKTPYVDIDINAVKCETAPAAPSQFAIASNHDNAVVASWVAAPGPVALYIVESGNASGMSDLPAREVDGRTLQINVQRIPPGTYYARVLAKNACGTSPASNEVKVVVK